MSITLKVQPKDSGWTIGRVGNFTGFKTKAQAEESAKRYARMYPGSKFAVAAISVSDVLQDHTELSDREHAAAIGAELIALLSKHDKVVGLEVYPPDPDANEGSFKLTLSDGYFQEEARANNILDALDMARAKIKQKHEAIEPVLVESHAPPTEPVVKKSAAGLSIKKK